MKSLIVGAAALLALGGGQEKAADKDLSWFAGAWSGTTDDGTFEEHWTTRVGGLMIGMGRLVKGEKTLFTEFLKIVETKDGLEYRAVVEGGPEVAFKQKSRSEGEIVFENLKHDFPK